MFSQDHLHHAAPEGAQNKKRELKSDILIVLVMSHDRQPFSFVSLLTGIHESAEAAVTHGLQQWAADATH